MKIWRRCQAILLRDRVKCKLSNMPIASTNNEPNCWHWQRCKRWGREVWNYYLIEFWYTERAHRIDLVHCSGVHICISQHGQLSLSNSPPLLKFISYRLSLFVPIGTVTRPELVIVMIIILALSLIINIALFIRCALTKTYLGKSSTLSVIVIYRLIFLRSFFWIHLHWCETGLLIRIWFPVFSVILDVTNRMA